MRLRKNAPGLYALETACRGNKALVEKRVKKETKKEWKRTRKIQWSIPFAVWAYFL
jgi:hypothetical protein